MIEDHIPHLEILSPLGHTVNQSGPVVLATLLLLLGAGVPLFTLDPALSAANERGRTNWMQGATVASAPGNAPTNDFNYLIRFRASIPNSRPVSHNLFTARSARRSSTSFIV